MHKLINYLADAVYVALLVIHFIYRFSPVICAPIHEHHHCMAATAVFVKSIYHNSNRNRLPEQEKTFNCRLTALVTKTKNYYQANATSRCSFRRNGQGVQLNCKLCISLPLILYLSLSPFLRPSVITEIFYCKVKRITPK